MSKSRCPMWALVGWAVLAASSAIAPVRAQPSPVELGDELSVTSVEIPVQVTRDGEPVRGLRAEAFVVREGRRRLALTGFEVVDLAAAAGPDPAGTRSPAPVEPPAVARRHFLLLFDLTHAEPKNLARAQEAAIALLASGLHPSDLVGVATYGVRSGARLVLGFTPDRRQAELAIRTLGAPELVDRTPDPLGLVLGEAKVDFQIALDRDGPDGVSTAIAEAAVDFFDRMEQAQRRATDAVAEAQLRNLADSWEAMARLLAAVPGRKQVVLFSEGFDQRLLVGREMRQDEKLAAERGDLWRLETDATVGSGGVKAGLGRMLEAFRRADAVIQAVDVGGVRAGGDAASVRVGGLGSDEASFAQTRGSAGGEEGLFYVANETGGELFRSFNDLGAAMDRLLARTEVTYLLSVQPEDLEADGAWHRLEIEVPGVRGARVVHRGGYFAPRPGGLASELEQRILAADRLFGRAGAGTVPAGVTATALPLASGRVRVPVVVEAAGRELLGSQASGLLSAHVLVYLFAEDGRVAGHFAQMVGVDAGRHAERLRGSGLRVYGEVELPAGHYRLRALVRNLRTDAYGVAEGTVAASAIASGPRLAPPVAVEPAGAWLLGRADGGDGPPYPFDGGRGLGTLVPAPHVPPGAVRLWTVVYGTGAPAALSVRVFDAAGGEVPGLAWEIEDRERGEGYERLLIVGGPLAAGRYRLEAVLEDGTSAGGGLAVTSRPGPG